MTKAKSNTMVPLTGTVVIRDGKRVRPKIGKAFDYEGDEIEQLEASGAKFRAPTDETETADADAAGTSTGKRAKPSAEASQAKARGGKKRATANESDEEAESEEQDGDADL